MDINLLQGDCRITLKTLADCSVDSIVTDPPYHLTTGKKGGSGPASVNLESPYGRARIGTGFMGMKWDGGDVAFDPSMWAECLRVLKPGGHLLAFSGTRTQHRMVCAIEDAGFEIRDQAGWMYGSGFPKSHNGDWGGTALKPAWEPICVARKPLVGTVEANWLVWGLGGLNIDGCRVPTDDVLVMPSDAAMVVGGNGGTGYDRPRKTDADALDRRRAAAALAIEKANSIGRWPANLIHDGSDGVLAVFPTAPGQLADASTTAPSPKTSNVYGAMKREGEPSQDSNNEGAAGFKMKPGARRLDEGSAARFFYCAKAGKRDRGADNSHPTVKPTDLMRYLCRLVTPARGVVLDPFLGSGSTGKAAILEGFSFIGCELNPEYLTIAKARIDAAVGDLLS